jgi:hypothetical protein
MLRPKYVGIGISPFCGIAVCASDANISAWTIAFHLFLATCIDLIDLICISPESLHHEDERVVSCQLGSCLGLVPHLVVCVDRWANHCISVIRIRSEVVFAHLSPTSFHSVILVNTFFVYF